MPNLNGYPYTYTNNSGSTLTFQAGCAYYASIRYYINGVANGGYSSTHFGSSLSSYGYTVNGTGSTIATAPTRFKSYDSSICSDNLGSTVINVDGSISYQPKVGIHLNSTDGTHYTGTLSDIPYDTSWDVVKTQLACIPVNDNVSDTIHDVDYIMDDTTDINVPIVTTTGASITINPNSLSVEEDINDIIKDGTDTTNGKGIARNIEKSGGFEQTLTDFNRLKP